MHKVLIPNAQNQDRCPASKVIMFQSGGPLKIPNSNKIRIYKTILTKLDTHIHLARSGPHFND